MMNPRQHKQTPLVRSDNEGCEFNPEVIEISIFDQRGLLVWKTQRNQFMDQIRWNGIDMFGRSVGAGDYLCKMKLMSGETLYCPLLYYSRAS